MTQLMKMLTAHEGVETHAYQCTANKTTIGVGRNIDPDGGLGLSKREIEFLLANDIERVEDELYKSHPWVMRIGCVRLDAMINICFNLGLPRFNKFVKAISAGQNGDWDKSANEFLDSKWASQVGNRAIEVTEMIRTGTYQKEY